MKKMFFLFAIASITFLAGCKKEKITPDCPTSLDQRLTTLSQLVSRVSGKKLVGKPQIYWGAYNRFSCDELDWVVSQEKSFAPDLTAGYGEWWETPITWPANTPTSLSIMTDPKGKKISFSHFVWETTLDKEGKRVPSNKFVFRYEFEWIYQ